MTYYLVIFAAGFAGGFHCIRMCGGFACALGRDTSGAAATVGRHLLCNAGRLTTYCFLGAVAGALGAMLCTSRGLAVPVLNGPLDGAQRILAIAAGLLMIAMALQFFGLFQRFQGVTIGSGAGARALSLRNLLTSRTVPPRLPLLGMFNGFLPITLVMLSPTRHEHRRSGARLSRHAIIRIGHLSRDVDDGGVGRMTPVWRQRGVWLAGSFIAHA